MKYNNLYVFGDSFSTPYFCVEPQDSYWGLLAKHIDADSIFNYSFCGNAWEGVIHTLVSADINFNDSLIILAIPPLERRLRFDNYNNTEHLYYTFNLKWDSFPAVNENLRGLDVLREFDNNGIVRGELSLFANRSWLETVLLRELFLITKWLDKENANYFIINTSAKELDKNNVWGPSSAILPYMLNHPCMMFEDMYHSINQKDNVKPADFEEYRWMGHHGPEGNLNFFNKSLLPELQKVKLI